MHVCMYVRMCVCVCVYNNKMAKMFIPIACKRDFSFPFIRQNYIIITHICYNSNREYTNIVERFVILVKKITENV